MENKATARSSRRVGETAGMLWLRSVGVGPKRTPPYIPSSMLIRFGG